MFFKQNKAFKQDNKTATCKLNSEETEDVGISLNRIIVSAVLFFISAVCTATQKHFEHQNIMHSISVSLCTASYMMCGFSVLKSAAINIMHGAVFDEKFLMAAASIAAVCIGEYTESAGIMLFYQIGEFFQDYAVNKSHDSINAVMQLRPDKASVIRNGNLVVVPPEDVNVGETILVKAGERIALDGVITKGNSYVDTSSQTGEPVPKSVSEGSDVLAGFVNTQGVIEIKVTKPFGQSSVVRIMKLIKNAAQNKAKRERLISRFARIYTPAVCVLSLLVATIPSIITGEWHVWLYRGIVVLVVSCPCALVVSVPLCFFGGIGAAGQNGILIKGGNYIEALAAAKTAVFDKTGTLTKGNFTVTDIQAANKSKMSNERLLATAAHAERFSTHPISYSLRKAHSGSCCDCVVLKNAQEISGQGVSVKADGDDVLAGNEMLMKSHNVTGYTPLGENNSGSVVHVAVNKEYAGHIVISDEMREDALLAIERIKNMGVKKTVMLTGDSDTAASAVATSLGIDTVYSHLMPKDKVACMEELLAQKKSPKNTVLYIGDGINDAPVLSRADVGIAVDALGSDAAIEAADVVLMAGGPLKLADAISISKRTVAIAKENIVFSIGVKALIMILGITGITGLWFAVFADAGVLIIAVSNAMRLLF